MPESTFVHKHPSEILSYEQIESFAAVSAELGISKIRLTGGEPMVRKDIEKLVAALSRIDGIEELCMTTNGLDFAEKAALLKRSGLTRVNISIDTLDSERYRRITRGGNLAEALGGVEAAIEAGLTPIKINMVVLDDTTQDDIANMKTFCERRGLELQRIMQFSLYDRTDLSERFPTERPPNCTRCNRLRLTADGYLKPCLFSNSEIRVDFNDIKGSILEAAMKKPESGDSCRNRIMRQIGG
jgi:cyclic pyranopterin phosphate synthase